ncbi:hypothetical protein M885DRAFT_90783 [Pelagophyceae sp. CCMP2097]|nr:hypothetical protein M885DRAFT_90783 [Pelagophyceae sp. CCMP2097]
MVSVVEGAALPLYAAERPQRAGGRSVESKAADILVMARSLVGPSSRRAAPGPRAKRGAPPRCKSQATVVTGVSQSQRAFASLRSTEYRSATMRDLMARQGSVDAWRGGDGDGGAEEPHFLKRPQAVEELDSDDAGGHRSRRGSRESRAGETRATEAFANSTDLASVSWHAVHGAAPAPAPAAPAGFSFGASQAELRAEYDARFSGLHGYGASGMTRLEEMVEAAMGASVKARRESQANDGRCAALLARSGAMYITRSVRSKTDPALSVGCERAAVLRAVSDGDTAFVGLVVVDCASDEIPAPDGGARQFLAEYGDFPVYLVNRGLSARRVTTHELFPLRSLAAPPRDAQPDDGPRSKKPRRRRLRIAEAPAPPESASSDAAPAFRKAPPKRRLRVTSDVDSDGGRRGGAFASARRENTSDEAGALRRRENTSDEASSDGGRADKRAVGFSRQRAEPASGESSAGSASGELPAKATDWSIDDVCEWLEFDVRVPAYAVAFRRAKVNGALLLRVDGDDLEATLEVKHALHRRRILAAIDALRDEALKQGAEQVLNAPDEVDAYFGTIDKERVRAVARLKVAFDAHATKRASDQVAVGVEGVRLALTQLGRDSSQWRPEGTYWTFLDFVDLYVENFSQDDPDLKASSGAAAALSERVRVLVSGHVELRPDGGAGRPKKLLTMGSAGGANGSRSRGAFGSPASRSRSGSASSEASQFGGGEGRRARERDATKAAKAADSELGSVRRLAELKQVFDRFAVHEAVTGAEALQALTELGCGCPRKAAAAYFRGRGFYGMRRDVSFFEFLRAFAALELEGDGPQKRPARSPSPEGRFAAPKSRRRSPSRSSGSSVDRAVDRLTRKPHSSLQQHVRRRRESRRGDKSSSDEGRSGFSSRGRQSARSSSRSGRASPPRSGRASPPRRSAQRRDDDSDDGRRRRAPAEDLRVGDRVEARFKKRATFYPGVIKRVHADGTFDVDYDDGEQETRVSAALIEVKARPKAAKAPRLNEGDKVEARYRGRSKFYPGKIVRDRGDGTFDIDYDDGEKESRIDEKLIKAVGGGSSPSSRRGRLSEGAKVEARYRGKSKFYPGRIFKDRGDSTYDVHYDDGEKETRVAADLIQPVGGAGVTNSRQSPRQSPPPRRGRLSEGAKVEARYRGRSKFYPGRISRDRGDGTFDIDYDDGEKETRVAEELITAAGGGGGREVASNLRRGEKVEARYRGRSKYYTGRVTRVCGDGAYDIDYDDGEKEQGVAEALIRSLEQSPSDGYQLSALD